MMDMFYRIFSLPLYYNYFVCTLVKIAKQQQRIEILSLSVVTAGIDLFVNREHSNFEHTVILFPR